MQRIAILGRGGAGKSTLARRLGERLDLPVVELDGLFWRPDLTPTPPEEWAQVQRRVLAAERWIVDGDLGPFDSALPERLARAELILVLDFPLWRCAWRALRRARENTAFWRWVLGYRRRSLPVILAAAAEAGAAERLRLVRDPRSLERLLAQVFAQA